MPSSRPRALLRVLVSVLLLASATVVVAREASGVTATIAFQLPFPVGQAWKANGPHVYSSASGVRNSVDLGPTSGDGQVVAAAAGRISSVTNCGGGYEVRIDHADGWQTGYYHLGSVASGVASGANVARGQAIGVTSRACATATFSHVQFSVRRNGVDQDLNGFSIGGHTVHSKSYNYGGWWTRNSDGTTVVQDVDTKAACCLPSLAVSDSGGGTGGGGGTGPPMITVSDASVTEGNCCPKNIKFTVSLSRASNSVVTVDYTTANGTATAGSDYVAEAGRVRFSAGVTTKNVAVEVTGDRVDEPNETLLVKLATPVRATIGDSQATGIVVDND